jgi:hypothetical protein
MRFILSILAFLLLLGCKSNSIGISENENSQKYQNTIKFEITIDNESFPGVSIYAYNSTYVTTDFDGKANLFINNTIEKVELSYMGKPTFVKIIKNCDFIKVDLSK